MSTKPSQILNQTLRLLSIIVALLAALLITTLVASALAEEDFSAEVVRLVNMERLNAGLPSLAEQPNLLPAATLRAQEASVKFSHTRPDGSKWKTIFNEHHIFPLYVGENLAMGQRSPKSVVEAWMDSANHRKNILNPRFDHIAVGLYEENSVIYWNQLFTQTGDDAFGTSSASAAAPLLAIVKITVAAPEPDDPGLREAKVTGTSSLNIRSRATTKSRTLASAAKESTLYVLETSGNWAYVRLPDGTEGWARAKYLAA